MSDTTNSSALRSAFEGLPVLVTGHTGFKGSWLSIWLDELGADVIGYSLDPPTKPSNFQVSHLADRLIDMRGDIRDLDKLHRTLEKYQPQVVFHLAAQAIVLRSYNEPKETLDTNAAGTVNMLEAVRTMSLSREENLAACKSPVGQNDLLKQNFPTGPDVAANQKPRVSALICITSDKCYENKPCPGGHCETDALGGSDPYSASKAMAELAIASYRRSFFPAEKFDEHGFAIASTRAGNVIGGGDYGDFRLVPDCMRALLAGESIEIRNPLSVRPWQHVLEPLSGYLWLAAKLLRSGNEFAEAWNFGPSEREDVTAREIVEKAIELWGSGSWTQTDLEQTGKERAVLRLNWDKAAGRLNWRPTYTWEEALAETVSWFKIYQERKASSEPLDMYDVCAAHIREYTERAHELGTQWAQ